MRVFSRTFTQRAFLYLRTLGIGKRIEDVGAKRAETKIRDQEKVP